MDLSFHALAWLCVAQAFFVIRTSIFSVCFHKFFVGDVFEQFHIALADRIFADFESFLELVLDNMPLMASVISFLVFNRLDIVLLDAPEHFGKGAQFGQRQGGAGRLFVGHCRDAQQAENGARHGGLR